MLVLFYEEIFDIFTYNFGIYGFIGFYGRKN